MSDVMTPEQRSRAMSHIKGKDTSIEVLLRKALWHKGIRYRKNYKKLPGTPDIAITKYKIAIFCDSEFFHGYNWEIQKRTEECVGAAEDLIFELQMMQFDGMIDDMRDCVEDIR